MYEHGEHVSGGECEEDLWYADLSLMVCGLVCLRIVNRREVDEGVWVLGRKKVFIDSWEIVWRS